MSWRPSEVHARQERSITAAFVRLAGAISHTNRRGSLPRWRTCVPLLQCRGKRPLPEDGPSRGQAAGSDNDEGHGHEVDTGRHSHFPKIIDRLLHFGVLRGVNRKLRHCRRNIVRRPMIPSAGGRIGIVAEQEKLRVPSGAPDHCRGGERFAPSQVNRRGIAAPSSKALETSFMALSIRLLGGIGSGLTCPSRFGPASERASDCCTSSRSRTGVIRLQFCGSILPVRTPKVCLDLEVDGALTKINPVYKGGFLVQ